MLFKKQKPEISQIVPSGTLKRLKPDEVIPSKNNPRLLFDDEPMKTLRESIRLHGVLVPITVYQVKGKEKYSILDGARRHHCCIELQSEVTDITIPANVVDAPDTLTGLLYMFSIHQLREQWELMPTALSLKTIMEELDEQDAKALAKVTGMSEPQIERCKLLLAIPERFQELSLCPDPKQRIPANLWIEALPVIELIEKELPHLAQQLGRDGLFEKLLEKYQAGNIKSVIHFRRIMEAYEVGKTVGDGSRNNGEFPEDEESRKADVVQTLQEYIEDVNLETRQAFDHFVAEHRQVQGALGACTEFQRQLDRLKLEYVVEKDELIAALVEVRDQIIQLLERLEGGDPPDDESDDDED